MLKIHTNKYAVGALKTASNRATQKAAEATGDLIEITRHSKTLSKNNSETNEEEILREKYIPPELIQKSLIT